MISISALIGFLINLLIIVVILAILFKVLDLLLSALGIPFSGSIRQLAMAIFLLILLVQLLGLVGYGSPIFPFVYK